MKVVEKGQCMLATKGDNSTGWNGEDVNAVLAWYNHPQRNKLTSKESKLKVWDELRALGKSPPTCERWTDDDEMELIEASKANITVNDTALGRAQMKRKHYFESRIETMSKAEWEAAVAKRESIDGAINFDANNVSDGAVGWV